MVSASTAEGEYVEVQRGGSTVISVAEVKPNYNITNRVRDHSKRILT
jgi:hypothetical protein